MCGKQLTTERAFPFYLLDNEHIIHIELLALVLFSKNTAKHSTTESKQTEGSRCIGVDYSVLVSRAGHLAVTFGKDKRKNGCTPFLVNKKNKMKRILFLILIFIAVTASAQDEKKVMIKAGTIIPLQSVNSVKAADVEEGQVVDFRVVQDVNIDGICAIQRGSW